MLYTVQYLKNLTHEEVSLLLTQAYKLPPQVEQDYLQVV